MWDDTCRIPWRGRQLLNKACALPPSLPLTWFLLMPGLSASAAQPSKSGFKPSEQVLGSWAANTDGGSSRLPQEGWTSLLQTCVRFFGSSQQLLLETGNSLATSPGADELVSALPAGGCPLGAVTVMSNEEGKNNSNCLALLFVKNLLVFISNLQAQPVRLSCRS